MKQKLAIFLSGIIATLILISKDGVNASQNNNPVFGNAGYELSNNEIPRLEKKALAGDQNSAFRLYKYYAYANVNWEKHLYWLTIAAENGSPEDEYTLGFELTLPDNLTLKSLGPEEKQNKRARGIFWLKKAHESGFATAGEVLKELGETSK